MKPKRGTDIAIAELVEATGARLSTREKRMLRESLHGLVRLAKSELMLEIKANAQRLTGIATASPRKQRTAVAAASARRDAQPMQQHFEFTRFD